MLFEGKPEGMRPVGRPRGRRMDNIKMGFKQLGFADMDYIGLAQDTDNLEEVLE
jgi:hypothetical protein